MGKRNRNRKKRTKNRNEPASADINAAKSPTSNAKEVKMDGKEVMKVSQRSTDESDFFNLSTYQLTEESKAASKSSQIVSEKESVTKRRSKSSKNSKTAEQSSNDNVSSFTDEDITEIYNELKEEIRREKNNKNSNSKPPEGNITPRLQKWGELLKSELPELIERLEYHIRMEDAWKLAKKLYEILLNENSTSEEKTEAQRLLQELGICAYIQDTTKICVMDGEANALTAADLEKDIESKQGINNDNNSVEDIQKIHTDKEKLKLLKDKQISVDKKKKVTQKISNNVCLTNKISTAEEAKTEALQVIKTIGVPIDARDPQVTTTIVKVDGQSNAESADLEKKKEDKLAKNDSNSSVDEIRDKASISVKAETESCKETAVKTDLEDEVIEEVATTTELDGEPKKQIEEKEICEKYFEFRTNGHKSFLVENEKLYSYIPQEKRTITFISEDKNIQIVIANNQLLVSTQNTELDISIRNSNTVNVTDEGTQTDSIAVSCDIFFS